MEMYYVVVVVVAYALEIVRKIRQRSVWFTQMILRYNALDKDF